MSEETKQPAEETPEEPQEAPQEEAPPAEEKVPDEKAEKAARGKKKKEKTYTLTREQMEAAELAARQLESVKDQFVRLTAEYDNYRKRTAKEKDNLYQDAKADTIKDMATGEVKPTGLPSSNVLYYDMEDGAWVCVRPSGTEPKIKAYYTTIGDTRADAEAQEEKLIEDFKGILGF